MKGRHAAQLQITIEQGTRKKTTKTKKYTSELYSNQMYTWKQRYMKNNNKSHRIQKNQYCTTKKIPLCDKHSIPCRKKSENTDVPMTIK